MKVPIGIDGMDGILSDMEVRTSAGAKVPHAEYFPPLPTPRGPSLWMARLAEDRHQLRGSGRSSRIWCPRSCASAISGRSWAFSGHSSIRS